MTGVTYLAHQTLSAAPDMGLASERAPGPRLTRVKGGGVVVLVLGGLVEGVVGGGVCPVRAATAAVLVVGLTLLEARGATWRQH